MPHQKSWRKFTSLNQAHNWLLSLDKKKKTAYTTKQIRAFLKYLDQPQEKYKVVHVGGTSGKGSTCQMLTAILKQAGYKVGLTTSPYLFSPLEKMQINQRSISEKSFVKLVNEHRGLILEFKLSYFEAYIALTLIYFAQQKVDYAVVEVGMGGRLDATNVFEDPELVIITNVELDHTQQLGKTIKKIRREKEAIIKNSKKVIRGKSLKRGEDFIKHNQELATQAAKFLKIKNKDVLAGLKKTKNPGRFEVLKKRPLVIRDGAHNPDKIQGLVNIIRNLSVQSRRTSGSLKVSKALSDFSERKIVSKRFNKKYLLIGIKDTKDYKEMLKIIVSEFDEIIFTSFGKSYNPKLLQKEIKDSKIIKDPKKAYQNILKKLKNNDLFIITGSLYLLGDMWDN